MKKILALILAALMLTVTFTGCAPSEKDGIEDNRRDDDDDDDDDKDRDDDDDDKKDKDDDDDDDKDKDDDDDKDKDDDDDKDKDDDDDDGSLSDSDYREQVIDLFCDYYSAIKDSSDVFNSLSQVSQDEIFDELNAIRRDVEGKLNTADKYLKKIKQLKAPKKMEDFHEDLVSAVENMQKMGETMVDVCDAADENELANAFNKMMSAGEKASEAFERLAEDDDYEWFTDEVEDKFGDDFFAYN